MNDPATREIGYAFALPRLVARLGGRKVRRAELSRGEAYGVGWLVFGIACVCAARALLPFIRPLPGQLLVALLLPFATWIAFLLLYFLNWLIVAFLRRLDLYSGRTNNSFQHFVIISLITFLALRLAQDESGWLKSLGMLWLGLVGLNLLALLVLKLRHES
ncbi:MAG TPA: hypothetical protein VNW28_07945 [Chthoniobacterales bacterium]|nr:hypothetical protein [Chthoniobacterales bacterium]